MGSKLRRIAKPSVDLSSNSSKSSGISPKSLTKSTHKTTASMDSETSTVAAGQDKNAEKKGSGSAEANKTVEVKKEEKAAPGLGYFSMQNGTLLTNARYQPHTYKGPKDMAVTPKSKVLSALSAESPAFVPAAFRGQNALMGAGAATPGAMVTPTKMPGHRQPGVFGASRHIHPGIPHPKAVAGPSNSNEFLPYNGVAHAKHLSDGSSGDFSLSPASVATSHTTVPSPYKVRENVVIHINHKKKDFIIDANGISLNRLHVDEYMRPDGTLTWAPCVGFNPANVLVEIAGLDEAGKEGFWRNHRVQIDVDLRDFPTESIDQTSTDPKGKGNEVALMSSPTVIDQLARLGPDFTKYVTRISANIIFPPPREGSVAPGPRGKGTSPDYSIAVNTPGFSLLQTLVTTLDACRTLHYLEVIINNPTASTTLPFNVEQLLYALPFYDLHCFEAWVIKWQGNYMREPVDVGSFPILLLDKERNNWLWAQKRERRDEEAKKRAKQERIDNMVFVRKSAAPEYTLNKDALPEPFQKPGSAASAPAPKAEAGKKDAQDKKL